MADGVRMIVELPDPVGEELESRTLYNGLELRKVRVPLVWWRSSTRRART